MPAQQPSPRRSADSPQAGRRAAPQTRRPQARGSAPRSGGAQPQPNPQRPGYNNTRAARRATGARRRRQRRWHTLLGFLLVLAVLIAGIVFSVRLFFKVSDFRIENIDGTTPANTGIYTEEQILALLHVQIGDNLFSFSTREKQQQLAAQLPYLESVQVGVSLPGTVVIKVAPAVEKFAIQTGTGWLILSEERKLLRTGETRPAGSIWLEALLPQGSVPVAGNTVQLETYDSLLDDGISPTKSDQTADEALDLLLQELQTHDLLEGVTKLTVTDLNELSFLFEDRVLVKLGTANNLSEKMQYARAALLDPEGKGLGAADRGTLDISYSRSDGRPLAYFSANDPTAPTPEPAETPDGENPDEPDGEDPDLDQAPDEE